MGVYIWKERLPSAYQEVEYIESSGTQWIDTGITPNDATYGFECKFNITNTGGDWGIMMACTQSVNHGRFGFAGYSTSNFQTGIYGAADFITTITPATGVDYTVIVNYNGDGKTSINGIVRSTLSPQGAETYSTPWTIFCYSYGTNSYARYGSFKLYYMKIYHGTTLVRELVPCYRKSDGVIGLYDLVNSIFYTNSGSGTFTKGQDINYVEQELKNAYIGEYRVPGENTVAYYKLDGNVNDYLGNYNGTWSGTSAYKTLSSGIQVAYMPESNALSYIYSSCQTLPKTVSFWFQKENRNGDGSGAKDWIQLIGQCNSESGNWQLRFNAHNSSQYNHFKLRNSIGENSIGGLVPNFGNTNWHNIVFTLTNGDNKLYYDGSLFGTLGGNCTVGGNLYMGGNPFGQNGTFKRQLAGCMSEVILEDKVRTAQEIANYYNSTKSNYGL